MLIIRKSNLSTHSLPRYVCTNDVLLRLCQARGRGEDAVFGRIYRNSVSSRKRRRSITSWSFCNRFSCQASYTHTRTYTCIIRYHFPLTRARCRTEFLISLFTRLIYACMRSRCINVENRGICSATVGMRRVRLSREICIGERGGLRG